MRICFPTEQLNGMESTVYGHFGSAPGFVIVDSESGSVEEIKNNDLHHAHGMCRPLKALGGNKIDAVAAGGIGMGALRKLHAQGIRVFRAEKGTVEQNLALFLDRKLAEFDARLTCGGHAGGGCVH